MGREGSERGRGLPSWKPVDSSKGQRGWFYETAVSSVETSHTDASFGKSNNPLEKCVRGLEARQLCFLALALCSCVSKPRLPSSSLLIYYFHPLAELV